MKVVIDTNIWVSYLLGKSFENIFNLIEQNNIEVFTSKKQLLELINTFQKPKLTKYISKEDVNNLIFLFKYNFNFVSIPNKLKFLRDPEDDYLIEIATESNAEFIITGDKDLLVEKEYKGIKFITYSDFIIFINN